MRSPVLGPGLSEQLVLELVLDLKAGHKFPAKARYKPSCRPNPVTPWDHKAMIQGSVFWIEATDTLTKTCQHLHAPVHPSSLGSLNRTCDTVPIILHELSAHSRLSLSLSSVDMLHFSDSSAISSEGEPIERSRKRYKLYSPAPKRFSKDWFFYVLVPLTTVSTSYWHYKWNPARAVASNISGIGS